uniref:Nonsense-mediated mRNA decay factor SMG8 n=1 Tax=Haptolina ericina TaxID=156174 RepID=A0A7S3FIU4_9EUKA
MNQLTPTTLQEVLAPSASTAASPSLHEAYGDSAATAVISMVQRMRQESGRADEPVTSLEVHAGCEYECRHGHRFFPPSSNPALSSTSASRAYARAAASGTGLHDSIELSQTCPADGCGAHAQLQRLYVRTPDTPRQLICQPIVQFLPEPDPHPVTQQSAPTAAVAVTPSPAEAKGGASPPEVRVVPSQPALVDGAHRFLCTPAILPRDSIVCLRLPYIYAYPARDPAHPAEILLTAATTMDPANARSAVLCPRWLRFVPPTEPPQRTTDPPPRRPTPPPPAVEIPLRRVTPPPSSDLFRRPTPPPP